MVLALSAVLYGLGALVTALSPSFAVLLDKHRCSVVHFLYRMVQNRAVAFGRKRFRRRRSAKGSARREAVSKVTSAKPSSSVRSRWPEAASCSRKI